MLLSMIVCVCTHSCECYIPENSCQSNRPHLCSLSAYTQEGEGQYLHNYYARIVEVFGYTSGLIIILCTGS